MFSGYFWGAFGVIWGTVWYLSVKYLSKVLPAEIFATLWYFMELYDNFCYFIVLFGTLWYFLLQQDNTLFYLILIQSITQINTFAKILKVARAKKKENLYKNCLKVER